MSASEDANEALEVVRAIRPLLVGKDVHVQGAVLADLLAMWLAGHVVIGNPKATRRMRDQVLKMHLTGVKALIDINYKMSVEPQIKARTQ